MIDEKNTKIAIVGLGYVGLPLAIEFGKYFETIGFDINEFRAKNMGFRGQKHCFNGF